MISEGELSKCTGKWNFSQRKLWMCQGNKAVRKLRIRFNPKWNSKNLITKIKCYPGVERSVFQYSRNLILELRIFSVETIAYFPVKISHYCLILFEKTWLGLLTGSLRLCPTPVETRLKSLLSELQDISLTNVETWEDLWTTEKGERTKYGWNIRKIKFCPRSMRTAGLESGIFGAWCWV